MDFTFSEELSLLRAMVRQFADQEIRPLAAEIDEKHEIPRALLSKLAELGLFGVPFPEELGGGGLGEMGYCVEAEELTRADFSVAVTVGASSSIGGMAIYLGGNDEQRKKWIPKIASGELMGCYALTEAESGSDPASMRTTAVRDGNDWVINGSKIWITNGDFADLITLFATTDRTKGSHGISCFVVERERKGVRAGPREKKMGQCGSATCPLYFEDVRVPDANRIGGVGEGFRIAMRTLDRGRLGLGGNCLGAAKECLALATKYAKERIQFGKPIAENQAIQMYLADTAAEIFAVESALYRTAWMCDQGVPFSRESAIVKLASSECLDRAADRAVQVHGGMGYSRDYAVERWYRDARVNRIYEGTNEIQRLVIARDVLKKGL
ncbi:MAG TPA: acyl-CoA dehydrogenase family protein [Planctomycetota bacterium]|nr:acyl-CoA dehydrogenase family protein [Planctomycetota bacterium]